MKEAVRNKDRVTMTGELIQQVFASVAKSTGADYRTKVTYDVERLGHRASYMHVSEHDRYTCSVFIGDDYKLAEGELRTIAHKAIEAMRRHECAKRDEPFKISIEVSAQLANEETGQK